MVSAPSLPGKWRRVRQSQEGNGKGVTMAHGLPLLESWRKVAMTSALLLLRSGVMATSITLLKRRRADRIPLLEGRRARGYGLCPLSFCEVDECWPIP